MSFLCFCVVCLGLCLALASACVRVLAFVWCIIVRAVLFLCSCSRVCCCPRISILMRSVHMPCSCSCCSWCTHDMHRLCHVCAIPEKEGCQKTPFQIHASQQTIPTQQTMAQCASCHMDATSKNAERKMSYCSMSGMRAQACAACMLFLVLAVHISQNVRGLGA